MNGKGKNNKQKQTRYSFYFWCLHFFSSYITVTLERRKQGLIMNEKNKYCPHIEKKGRGKSEVWISNSVNFCDTFDFYAWQLHWDTQEGSKLIGRVSVPSQTEKYTCHLVQAVCNTHISSHVQAGICRREEDSYFPLLVTLTTWSQLFLSPRTVS